MSRSVTTVKLFAPECQGFSMIPQEGLLYEI